MHLTLPALVLPFELTQPTVDQRRRHCALADRAGNTFGRTVSHVARREEAWDTCLKSKGVPRQRPPLGAPSVG